MLFTKDLLIIDFEGNRFDGAVEDSDPGQIGAVLLDKDSLEEKDHFMSYVYFDVNKVEPTLWSRVSYSKEDIEQAPKGSEVGKQFVEKFGYDVFLTSWVTRLDMLFLKRIVEASGNDFNQYDYHYLDLWPVTYVQLLKQGYQGDIHSSHLWGALGLPERDLHDALDDCRFEAEVLRKIMFEV